MNSTKFFIITLLVCFLGLGFASVSLGQENATEAVNLDENIQAEDLDIEEPTLLPDSPFYFLKNWGREIRSFFTFNTVKKAELKSRFANERLIEIKKMIEQKKNPEIIKKGLDNYQNEMDKIKEASEKIKEKAEENPKVSAFLDKLTKHQFLHQNLLLKLKEQVPAEVFEKIEQARERHLKRFGEVMTKLEDKPEQIQKRLEENLEAIKGSKYKNFKNLEILLELEENVPEQAKEAIRKVQENTLKKLQGDLEKMSPDDQEKFNEYIENISGDKEKHLDILENLKSELKETPILIEKLMESREKIIKKLPTEAIRKSCPLLSPPASDFCKDGRIVPEKDEKGCIISFRCILPGEVEIPKIRVLREPHCDWCGEACVKVDPRHTMDCPAVEPPEDLICIEEDGKCITKEKPETCITLWDPVCGKNGKTYSNTCFAKLAKVEIDYKGVCK
ncbi:MAG: DUF5667 domain-containing protein [Minisyncoccales bacterium]